MPSGVRPKPEILSANNLEVLINRQVTIARGNLEKRLSRSSEKARRDFKIAKSKYEEALRTADKRIVTDARSRREIQMSDREVEITKQIARQNYEEAINKIKHELEQSTN